MIIDINAYLGHYPFRQMQARSASQLLELMDRSAIDRALVSSLHSVFYRDAQRGNEELFAETQPHSDRLICVATVNPSYVGWQTDLEHAVQHWGMKAVTLVPSHHGYSLSDELAGMVVESIVQHDLPLVLTQRFEDRRQRHHWDMAEDLELKHLLDLARSHPDLRVVLSNWSGLDGQKLRDAGLRGRCLIDFARLHVLLNKDVFKLIDTLGVEAIAFGSHMPFDYVAPSLIKLSNLESLSPAEYEDIAWRNAAKFLKLM